MTGTTRAAAGETAVVSLSVHGPVGVIDLVVPTGASAADVAREYARQTRLPSVPVLHTRSGQALAHDVTLVDAGVASGAILVALVPRPGEQRSAVDRPEHVVGLRGLTPGPLSVLWFTLAGATAVLAGWFTALLEPSDLRTTAVGLLLAAAALGVLPLGALAAHRVLVAPAFAGAAAFALVWDPVDERLPTILGVSALAAAVTAAIARSLDRHAAEGLRVWMVVGSLVFLVTGGAALAGVASQVVWATLLVVAMLAPRFVPVLAVDVPDQYLIDLERLAVTAWSARDRPTGRRGRIIVPQQAVATIAASGTRMVTAACVAILVVTVFAVPLLVREATLPLDRVGVRFLLGFAGGAFLLAARSYRHAAARTLLRASGLVCWLVLAVVLFGLLGDGGTGAVAGVAIALAGLLVVVGVALGRGWRSAWWARRAEVGEAVCGAFALGALVVAVGLFRFLWELTG